MLLLLLLLLLVTWPYLSFQLLPFPALYPGHCLHLWVDAQRPTCCPCCQQAILYAELIPRQPLTGPSRGLNIICHDGLKIEGLSDRYLPGQQV
jgi:hypothetical protein